MEKVDIKKLVNAEIEAIKEAEIAEKKPIAGENTVIIVEESGGDNLPAAQGQFSANTAINVVSDAKDEVLKKARVKIGKEKITEKHANKLTAVADNLLKAETEKAEIEVKKRDASNRAERQEIKNRLIRLKNEAKRIRKDEKFKNHQQKISIETQKKQAQWERLKGALEPLGYTYVPNFIALNIILMLTGLKAFFNGLGKLGTAVVKCFKWVIILSLVIAVVFIIPVTRQWILEVLGYINN